MKGLFFILKSHSIERAFFTFLSFIGLLNSTRIGYPQTNIIKGSFPNWFGSGCPRRLLSKVLVWYSQRTIPLFVLRLDHLITPELIVDFNSQVTLKSQKHCVFRYPLNTMRRMRVCIDEKSRILWPVHA